MSDLSVLVLLAVWLACPILIWRAVCRCDVAQKYGIFTRHVSGALSGGVALLPVVVVTSLLAGSGWLYPVSCGCLAACWYLARRIAAPDPVAEPAKPAPASSALAGRPAGRSASSPVPLAPIECAPPAVAPDKPHVPAPNPDAVSEAQFIVRCEAVAADGWIDDGEAFQLQDLLRASPWLLSNPRIGQLSRLLEESLQDGEIDPIESVDLIALIESIGGNVPAGTFSDWEPVGRPKRTRSTWRTIEGSKLDVINFAYLNAKGETSDRRMVVRMIDGERFAGRCLLRNAHRTFRLDRVQGVVTSELTGEVADAMGWADGIVEAHAQAEMARSKAAASIGNVTDFSSASMSVSELKAVGALEIAFTGFASAKRESLEDMAAGSYFIVRKNVTKNLNLLCAGPRAGASKLEKAQAMGASILDEDDFLLMVKEAADA
ncbi:hypothetical protein [Craterilacuibacter sp. RT1T]|uniref:hypothetical protein n=1 Tax=Craterilacuibacter sp. RT1T TaxID=2942211 RepID=UPI0020BFD688|nr:hypothetical protein [Craterilacuibacter sp. RT1T]MCL6262153.1 hypothetical protein [Craterilacuibacter sp. RT1T]